jgi:hypothetical protein
MKVTKVTSRSSIRQKQQGAGAILPLESVKSGNLHADVHTELNLQKARKNYAQNAVFRFFQLQDPATLTTRANDTYGPDQWYALTSGANVQFARVAETPSGTKSKYACQIRQADASASRFGFAQILEFERVVDLRGETVTFSVLVRTDGTEVSTVRAGLVEWTGTADTVTSNIISGWAATPTLIANAAFVNTPEDHAITGTYTRITVTATLGTTFNNLILFIWAPNAEAQNDDFYVKEVQVVLGDQAVAWPLIALPFHEDERECLRYVCKSYNRDVAPGTVTTVGQQTARGTVLASSIGVGPTPFPAPMRATPTITVYSPSTGASGNWHDGSAPLDRGAGISDACEKSWRLATNGYTGNENLCHWHYVATAQL